MPQRLPPTPRPIQARTAVLLSGKSGTSRGFGRAVGTPWRQGMEEEAPARTRSPPGGGQGPDWWGVG